MDLDGRRDFDFLHGSWAIRNRRLACRLESSEDWQEFDAVAELRPILGGLGNVDAFSTAELPGVGRSEGFAARLFDPARRCWSIFWASTGRPGDFDPPLVGSFDGDQGTFFGEDTFDGRSIRVRFEWDARGGREPGWQQAFSADDGRTWEVNWVMEFTPIEVG